MTTHGDKFNRTFQEFVADLLKVYPDDADLRMYQVAVGGMLLAAPGTLQTGFYEHVTEPYGDRIVARDETFFLNNDYAAETEGQSSGMELVNKLKRMYATMSEADKDAVFRYMRLLVLLSRKMFADA